MPIASEGKVHVKEPAGRRITWLAVGYVLLAVVVVIRLWILQVVHHERYLALASNQQESHQRLLPTRGQIFAEERDGQGGKKRVPIAVNQESFLIYADTREITDAVLVAESLAPLLGKETKDLLPILQKPNDPYEPIQHRVSAEVTSLVKAKELPGIRTLPETSRFYPNQNVGSHISGFVRYRDDEMHGQYGIEGYFDTLLAGQAGEVRAERDASGGWIALGDRELVPAKDGSDIVLTIDSTIQFYACRALNAWVTRHGASGGSVVVMNPKTGAVVAMCGAPDFNPSVYSESDITSFNNPAIFLQYEPGSVFKPFTMAAALEEKKVTPSTTYEDTGEVKIASYTIRNSDLKAHGIQTMTQVLEESLNTGVIFAMRQIGAKAFGSYVEKFGFGKSTGIGLSGEAAGDISRLKENNEIYPATASFGQGISVTPLQVVSAFASIANGGTLMKPHIVSRIENPDGTIEETKPEEIRRVISPQTSALLSGMLVNVVENGHGKKAGVPGYYVAGKTGTAQIPRADGRGYEEGATIGSFVGFAPVNDPAFVMIVRVDRPKDVQFAESSAAPLFGDIAKFILQYYEIPTERTIR